MDWKFTDDRPVYLQIISQIQGAVLKGEFLPGQRLPSVRELAAQARVNPNTMQHAFGDLERSGLLVTQGTSGRFVTEDPEKIRQVRQECVKALVAQVAAQFADQGVSLEEAAKLLLELKGEDVYG